MSEELPINCSLISLMEFSKSKIYSKETYVKDAQPRLEKALWVLRNTLVEKIKKSNNQELVYLGELLLGRSNEDIEKIKTLISYLEKTND